MFDLIKQFDIYLLIFINNYLSNPLFDIILPLFDNPKYWILPLLLLWLIVIYTDKDKRYQLLILLPIVLILTDVTGAYIKSFHLRERPWYELGTDLVNHFGSKGGKHKSFPSNHAANVTGLAIVLSSIYYKYKNIFWGVAITISISRIYIGVHYPIDIIAGSIIGITYGLLIIYFWNKLIR